jgi:hypothetical protein
VTENDPRSPEGREDDALLEELRALAARLDPVPERVQEGARAAYTWRTIDAELLALTGDSAFEPEREPALVRATTGPRVLVFESEHLAIEMEVTPDSQQHLRIVGQLVPATRAEIEVQQGAGALTTESDELGRFLIEGLSPGPARLRCRVPAVQGGRWLATEWTQV